MGDVVTRQAIRVCLQVLAALLAVSALLLRSASGDTPDPAAMPTESGGSPPAIPGSGAAAQGQAAAGPAQASADQASAPALYTYKVWLRVRTLLCSTHCSACLGCSHAQLRRLSLCLITSFCLKGYSCHFLCKYWECT